MKKYLTPSEHEFKEWLAKNPNYAELSPGELAKLYGKSTKRIYQLIQTLDNKGHIKRMKKIAPKNKITLL